MNHYVARSAMKRVVTACYSGRYVSSSAATAGMRAFPPFDPTAASGVHVQGISMVLIGWRRMMSTAPAPEPSKPSSTVEKDIKGNELPTKKVEKGDVVISSYWGVSRPKITREDGTEWPWNCFMVIRSLVIA